MVGGGGGGSTPNCDPTTNQHRGTRVLSSIGKAYL